ncbi:MAG: hypothetical protein WDM85_00640 [Caulobacteraceae bacterium]
MKIGAIAGLSSVMLVLLYARPGSSTPCRTTVCCRRSLRRCTSASRRRGSTPSSSHRGAGFAGFMSSDKLGELTNVGSLAAFAIVCGTVIYLRITHKDMARPFKTPVLSRGADPGRADVRLPAAEPGQG